MNDLKIPVGISDFAKIQNYGYYYVDKTGLIADLLEKETAEVTLITRPRRFGKTMGMSMLANFFDIRKDSKAMFEGLEISKNETLCSEWMNQWPVLFISFRRVDGLNFQSAFGMLQETIMDIYGDHLYLLDSPRISGYHKEIMDRILRKTAPAEEIKASLLLLTKLMQAHYKKPVILLLDEYDVPIAKASAKGYYAEMLDVVKCLMQALKDNDALRFAVITGCLRIAKESIFTGTNNFVSDTISSSHLNEYFGFTQADVDQILKDANCLEHAADIKNWYDGYHFGDLDVYCPWDVMNYLRDLQRNPKAKPASYWKNTSDNSIIRSFIDYSVSPPEGVLPLPSVPDVEEPPLSVPPVLPDSLPVFSLFPLFVLVSGVLVLSSPPVGVLPPPAVELLSCLPSFASAPVVWLPAVVVVCAVEPSPVASAVMGTRESTIDSVITRAKNFFFMGLLLFFHPFAFESPIVVGC